MIDNLLILYDTQIQMAKINDRSSIKIDSLQKDNENILRVMPESETIIVTIMSHSGYNQEDGLLFSSDEKNYSLKFRHCERNN